MTSDRTSTGPDSQGSERVRVVRESEAVLVPVGRRAGSPCGLCSPLPGQTGWGLYVPGWPHAAHPSLASHISP